MINQIETGFPARPGIIFMGTPDFAVPALKALVENGHRVLCVITQPDRPRGRGRKILPSSVKKVATGFGLEVLQPVDISTPEFCRLVRLKSPDLFVVVAFGQILRKDFLNIPRWGALNIHASLLPRYRGAAPIHWAILNDERTTGLTAMRMDEGLDSGPILLQEEIPILPHQTAGQLHDHLSEISGDFLLKTLKGLSENCLDETPQDESSATYAPKIDRKMSFVDWKQSARRVSAFIRALDPWPGALARYGGREIKLFSARVGDGGCVGGVPGRVVGYSEGTLQVETGKGVVQIGELQIPGRRRLAAKEFLKGFPLDKDTLLS